MIIHKCNRVTLWRKRKRFGTKAACPPFLFIPDTHSRTLRPLSEKPKQSKKWAGFGKCVITVLSIMICQARRHWRLRNSLLSCLNWSPEVFPSPLHPQSAGQVGERWWRRHQLKALALQLSPGLHLILFFCFFDKTFIDFLAEGIWVTVLQKSRCCLSHLKIQHLAHVDRRQGCCSRSLQELFLRFFFSPGTGWHRQEAPSPKASSPPAKRWSLQDSGQDEPRREPPQWMPNTTYPLNFILLYFFWTNLFLCVKEKHFSWDFWQLMARLFTPWRPRVLPFSWNGCTGAIVTLRMQFFC